MSKGILAFITEAADIKNATGCTIDESFELQRKIADAREQMAAQEEADGYMIRRVAEQTGCTLLEAIEQVLDFDASISSEGQVLN